MERIMYRCTATGIFEYVMCTAEKELFRLGSPVMPNAPVLISGETFTFVSHHDREITLVPGYTFRDILDEDDGHMAGRLRWDGADRYTLFFRGEEYKISCGTLKYVLTDIGGRVRMELTGAPCSAPVFPAARSRLSWCEVESAFVLYSHCPAAPELSAVFSAFPLLRFAL